LSLRETLFEAYAEAVLKEIESRRDEIAATSSVNTLYIGGGTPSVLPLDVLSRIVAALAGRGMAAEPVAARGLMNGWLAAGETGRSAERGGFGVIAPSGSAQNWDEFTVEVNPEDIVEKGEEYVRGLLDLGVNRISMGIQSFDDGILNWMNRRHGAATAEEAFRLLRRCGVDNISVDLIFGLSQLDESTWAATIDRTLILGPEHISAYQLSVEEDSALEKLIAKGKYIEASEDQCRRQYDILCAKLREAGYRHYEISNFALPGREAVHNSAYWRRVPYVGLGPGAHSLSVDTGSRSNPSVRSWNSQEIPRRLGDGSLATYSREEEVLTPEDICIERIMLPLRTDLGMPEEELRSLAGHESVDRLISEGALVRSQGRIRIPEDHFFTSDEIIRELI
jgi:oxygen-independent coproporphyrinogen-3 oxidase